MQVCVFVLVMVGWVGVFVDIVWLSIYIYIHVYWLITYRLVVSVYVVYCFSKIANRHFSRLFVRLCVLMFLLFIVD